MRLSPVLFAAALAAAPGCSDESVAPAPDAAALDVGALADDALAPSTDDASPGPDAPDAALEADAADVAPPETACNGADALCTRRFDEVCFPMTHNSMSNEDGGWIAANQTHGLTRQLEDGIRGLMLDVHPYEDQVYLCHGICELGKQLLVDGLGETRAFLDAHPREIVSIIFEPYVPPADIAAAMDAAGLTARLYAHPPGTPWPTLQAMIDRDTRLVVFAESNGGEPAWSPPAWDVIFDTNYSAKGPAELLCDLNRGAETNDLFLINNFIGNPLPSIEAATEVNQRAFLYERAKACGDARGHIPNFLGVDFYEVGDVLGVARVVNGLEAP